jgi:hypothetical protein
LFAYSKVFCCAPNKHSQFELLLVAYSTTFRCAAEQVQVELLLFANSNVFRCAAEQIQSIGVVTKFSRCAAEQIQTIQVTFVRRFKRFFAVRLNKCSQFELLLFASCKISLRDWTNTI